MFGQMTAGSWIYIGTQGILQGTYQTFAAAGEKHFGSPDLSGRTILTAGLGGMGGAQPLAATMAGAAILCVEVDPSRIERRLETRYLDEATDSLDDALARVRAAAAEGRALSVGLLANAADVVPELARRGEHFDLVTDQTAAHDPLTGYVPAGARRRGGGGAPRARPGRVPPPGARVDRRARAGHARVRRGRAATSSTTGTTCEARPVTRAWRTRSRTRASSRRTSGRSSVAASGRSGGRCSRAIRRTSTAIDRELGVALPRRRAAPALARARAGARRVPGAAGADLLARLRRSARGGARDQRARALGRGVGAGRHRARPPRLGLGRVARTARPRRCATAPTRSRTGRS